MAATGNAQKKTWDLLPYVHQSEGIAKHRNGNEHIRNNIPRREYIHMGYAWNVHSLHIQHRMSNGYFLSSVKFWRFYRFGLKAILLLWVRGFISTNFANIRFFCTMPLFFLLLFLFERFNVLYSHLDLYINNVLWKIFFY